MKKLELKYDIETILTNKLLGSKLYYRYGFAKYNDRVEFLDFHGDNSYCFYAVDFNNDYDLMTKNIINYIDALNTK